jgi:hypothetical protein
MVLGKNEVLCYLTICCFTPGSDKGAGESLRNHKSKNKLEHHGTPMERQEKT